MEEVWRMSDKTRTYRICIIFFGRWRLREAIGSAPRRGAARFDESDPVEPRQPVLVRPREVIE